MKDLPMDKFLECMDICSSQMYRLKSGTICDGCPYQKEGKCACPYANEGLDCQDALLKDAKEVICGLLEREGKQHD